MDNNVDFQSINKILYDNFDIINRYFDLGLRHDGEYWVGSCPLHANADNPQAFKIFPSYSFFCFTNCPNRNNYSLIELVRILLYNKFRERYGIYDTIEWIANNLFAIDINNLPQTYSRKRVKYTPQILYESVSEWMKNAGRVPSPSYVGMGYAPNTVKQFYIGECTDRTSRFYNRIIVPVFNRKMQVVGITGRSMYPPCKSCKGYHSPLAPGAKWLHSYGFKTGYFIYGSWDIPKGTREICIVESVGNVLRMREAGQNNTGAIFGCTVKTGQAELMEWLGIRRINLIIDNDVNQTGLLGAHKTIEKFTKKGWNFQFRIIIPEAKDVAMYSANELRKFLDNNKVKRI